jgi:CheY-like chemotaxis protein
LHSGDGGLSAKIEFGFQGKNQAGSSLMIQAKKSVLIAEDYEDTRSYMKFLLEMEGYTVYEAGDGKEAVEAAKENLPDIILMDMSMPVMDGLTATKKLREHSATADLPIIAVTAHGKAFQEKALEAGCDELIAKPLDPEVLTRLLQKYVEAR